LKRPPGKCGISSKESREPGGEEAVDARTTKLAEAQEAAVIVGVDVAKRAHWARVIDPRGRELVKPLRFDNSRVGFLRLEQVLAEALGGVGLERVIVGLEPSGHYWKPLAWHLYSRGIRVVLVNPYHVKCSKELDDNSQLKSDRKDALLVASLVQQGRFLGAYFPEGAYADLRVLVTERFHLKRRLNSAINRLRGMLDEYFPEYEGVFRDLLGKASWWVLRHCPFPQDVLEYDPEGLATSLKLATRGRVGMKRARVLMRAASESVGVKAGIEGARQKLYCLLDEIEFYRRQLEVVEARMRELLERLPEARLLMSIPGVGPLVAATVLGEVGDFRRFRHWKQLRKLAGYNLVAQSSGQKEGRSVISKRGRPVLRHILYLAALATVTRSGEFRALYESLRMRQRNPLKGKQALVAVATKILRIMFALVKSGQEYCPGKLLGRCQQQLAETAA